MLTKNRDKVCPKCKKELPIECFSKNKNKKSGLNSWCKRCMKKEYYRKHPKRIAKDGFKICSKCKKEFPATNEFFNRAKREKDGLDNCCRKCSREYHRKYSREHKEKRDKYYKEHKEEIAERGKKWRQEHREEKHEYNRKYYQKNKERIAEFQKNHREERIKYEQSPIGVYLRIKHRIKSKNLHLLICSKKEFVNWCNQQEQKCVYCDIPVELLKPLEWGAKQYRNRLTIDREDNNQGYIIGNICLACGECNRAKNNYWTAEETRIMAQREIKPKWLKLYKIYYGKVFASTNKSH